jgi:hypothetical protein
MVVLAALVLSDLLLGFSPGLLSLGVYAGFLAGIGLGRWMGPDSSWLRKGATVISNTLAFFIITNFVVWALPVASGEVNYPHTAEGLLQCYVMALPFLRNAMTGDLFWAAMLFGLFGYGRTRFSAHSHA